MQDDHKRAVRASHGGRGKGVSGELRFGIRLVIVVIGYSLQGCVGDCTPSADVGAVLIGNTFNDKRRDLDELARVIESPLTDRETRASVLLRADRCDDWEATRRICAVVSNVLVGSRFSVADRLDALSVQALNSPAGVALFEALGQTAGVIYTGEYRLAASATGREVSFSAADSEGWLRNCFNSAMVRASTSMDLQTGVSIALLEEAKSNADPLAAELALEVTSIVSGRRGEWCSLRNYGAEPIISTNRILAKLRGYVICYGDPSVDAPRISSSVIDVAREVEVKGGELVLRPPKLVFRLRPHEAQCIKKTMAGLGFAPVGPGISGLRWQESK